MADHVDPLAIGQDDGERPRHLPASPGPLDLCSAPHTAELTQQAALDDATKGQGKDERRRRRSAA